MIGSLLYLIASCLDIMFSMRFCSHFQSSPKESHLTIMKCIFRYLVGTKNFGLWYPKGGDLFLIGYSNANYAGFKEDKKSTSGTCQFLSESLVL